MGRGRERSINCAKCGRHVRRDKAVFIEKPMLQNPIERKDIYDDQYVSVWKREVGYCPSCGKHLRVYEKKIKQVEAQKEREERSRFSHFRPRIPMQQYYDQPKETQSETKAEDKTAGENAQNSKEESEGQQPQ